MQVFPTSVGNIPDFGFQSIGINVYSIESNSTQTSNQGMGKIAKDQTH